MKTDLYTYRGPGVVVWLFSLACSVLVATDALIGRSAVLPHSAESYYMRLPQARFCQIGAVVVDLAVLISALIWIIFPNYAKPCKTGLLVLSVIGIGLAWFEIGFAVKHGTGPVYILRELPFRPIANFGLLGAQVFATYLTFQIPSGKLPGWQTTFVKLALAGCMFAYQSLLWDGIVNGLTRSS